MGKIEKEKIQFNAPSSISITEEDGPETYPLHWHNAAEFTLVLKDGCKYRVNDVLYELSAGDILLVWPQQIHETLNSPHGSAIFIQFPAAIIENNLDLVSISRFLFSYRHISAKDAPQLSAAISEKFFEIKKIHNSSDPLSETRCKLCIYDILLKIGEYVISENKKISASTESSGAGWNYIHAACNYIVDNADDDISQKDVADYVGLSTFYFSKLFKQYMHMSFPAYLSNIRVKNAASLLLDESLSVTECAFLAGFQSTTTFNKAFLAITGYSPRDYRKLNGDTTG
ncbi:MAG: AraC family transcriptional regulator [Butyrivibrio sp.]|nr:AraC family transcriptional regulator [Butyrivibrio sp.]